MADYAWIHEKVTPCFFLCHLGFQLVLFWSADPSSNLTHIQEVSDWILNAKLPLNLADLMKKLEELKNLADSLPDSSSVLKEAEPQLDAARKLLQEAQDARWASLMLHSC